jgi:DNA-directed RNA polymerase subunit RPC12/RpoP
MAWFLNFYKCARCRRRWTDEWSCTCDDECTDCGERDMSPFKSEDLTELIEQDGHDFIALRSPSSAEHDPAYIEVGRFTTRKKAEEFLAALETE